MNPRFLLAFCMTVVAGAAFAATPDELVPVQSRYLDKVYLRPNADLAAYRRVLIDPVQVEIRNDWLTHMNAYNRDVSRWVGPEVGLRIARETASSLQGILAEAFKARGYEIATAPEPGVLRVSPTVVDLYVNAPDRFSPWRVKTFTRDAGQATLLLEARDAMSGTLLGRVEHRGIAREMGGQLTFTNDVTNRFWFDALFRRWAESCVAEFGAGKY
jgi:uncharacterized protein DUF3313